MSPASGTLVFEWVQSLADVPAAEWDALVEPDFPFSRHAFLHAFETTGSVGEGSGWEPRYLLARDGGRLVGAVFSYVKTHSYGEYIFDWSWAQAFERAGVAYYPKRLSAVPMTPATGQRLLVGNVPDVAGLREALVGEVVREAQARAETSVHFLFCAADEMAAFEANGFFARHTFQFHWKNRGYRSFEDFLAAFKSRKRKQIAAERRALENVPVAQLSGDTLSPAHAAVMDGFYRDTCAKKGAFAYLQPGFFEKVFAEFRNSTVLFLAGDPSNPLAASLCFRAGQHLYGRYWGAREEVPGLHFELCYYRPIEYAIAQGLTLFEAGAQGEHKVARGFLPEVTYSAHRMARPEFHAALARFAAQERAALERGLQDFQSSSPYRSATP